MTAFEKLLPKIEAAMGKLLIALTKKDIDRAGRHLVELQELIDELRKAVARLPQARRAE